jgi:lysophospholipase L1-like esterase
MQLRPGAFGGHSLLLLLRMGAKAVLALALVTSLIATGLLAVSLPRTAKLPLALISPSEGFSFIVPSKSLRDLLVPPILSGLYEPYSDGMAQTDKSELVIREDGRELGPAHQLHVKIRSDGGGAYSDWDGALYISTSDNSDVRTNGRSYEVETYLHATPWLERTVWISIESALTVALCAALSIIFLYRRSRWTAMRFLKSTLENSLLVAILITLCFGCLEGFLWAWSMNTVVQPANITVLLSSNNVDADHPPPPEVVATANSRLKILTLPDSWKRMPTEVAGAARADYWHGALEVYNSDGLRWATPFPEKRDDTYRVMVVGDSLTYGDGLSERWRFSNLLAEWMGQRFRIEFINLGHDGYQSEDILNLIRKDLPLLKPNLVFYAVCLNDFLPSGRAEYETQSAYSFPLPEALKRYFIQNTRAGAYLNEIYDGALRRLHLRGDFFDDILATFNEYQARFAHDVAQMNERVLSVGLPPLVGMVVDQFPAYDGRGYQIAMIAEAAIAKAGAIVIPTEDYYRRHSGQWMNISRWEGHPNEVANWIWANMIARALRERDDLQAFRK